MVHTPRSASQKRRIVTWFFLACVLAIRASLSERDINISKTLLKWLAVKFLNEPIALYGVRSGTLLDQSIVVTRCGSAITLP